MKAGKIKNRNFKLFKYNVLKLQMYSNKSYFIDIHLTNSRLEQIETYLKQILKVIFEYHVWQFKILFIGFPILYKMKQRKLACFTNHDFLTEKSWVNGIFRNRFSILTYLKLLQSQNFSKNIKLLLTVKTKPHLVVLFNQQIETGTISEFYKAGIPVLSFNWNFLNTSKIAYKALGNFNFINKNTKLTFFFLFYSLLKKRHNKPFYRKFSPLKKNFQKKQKLKRFK